MKFLEFDGINKNNFMYISVLIRLSCVSDRNICFIDVKHFNNIISQYPAALVNGCFNMQEQSLTSNCAHRLPVCCVVTSVKITSVTYFDFIMSSLGR
jgi:hypothetical protein